jgi:seryl-tRNA synthetase
MLELSFIRDNKERVVKGLKVRNFTDEGLKIIDKIIDLDDIRKAAKTEQDSVNAERNQLSREIGALVQQGKREEAEMIKTGWRPSRIKAPSLTKSLKRP